MRGMLKQSGSPTLRELVYGKMPNHSIRSCFESFSAYWLGFPKQVFGFVGGKEDVQAEFLGLIEISKHFC
jgi:hypothetical protein